LKVASRKQKFKNDNLSESHKKELLALEHSISRTLLYLNKAIPYLKRVSHYSSTSFVNIPSKSLSGKQKLSKLMRIQQF